jgi:ABC-type multidrug transport system fused ATPase/permease subunit
MNNYNIFNGLNTTVLSVLVAVFTSAGIEMWANQDFSIAIVLFIVGCFISAILLITAIWINEKFVQKCISTKNEPKNKRTPIDKIKESVLKLHKYGKCKIAFWTYTIASFLIFFASLIYMTIESRKNSQSALMSSIEYLTDSIQHLNGKIEQQNEIICKYLEFPKTDTISTPNTINTQNENN